MIIQFENNSAELILHPKKDHFQKLLEDRYPIKFVIGHSAFVFVICITLIGLQIAMTQNASTANSQYIGIWVSLPLVFTATISILVSK